MAKALYWIIRFRDAADVQMRRVLTGTIPASMLLSEILSDVSKPATYTSVFTGDSMSPTINSDVEKGKQGEKLLVRRLENPSKHTVFVDDVVVMRDPYDERRKYVRRIAALENEKLISGIPGQEPIFVPRNHCWVLCDNLKAKGSPDSRLFGPVSMNNILGRVMYAMRNATDHGRIINSQWAMQLDDVILAVERQTLK